MLLLHIFPEDYPCSTETSIFCIRVFDQSNPAVQRLLNESANERFQRLKRQRRLAQLADIVFEAAFGKEGDS